MVVGVIIIIVVLMLLLFFSDRRCEQHDVVRGADGEVPSTDQTEHGGGTVDTVVEIFDWGNVRQGKIFDLGILCWIVPIVTGST